MIVSAHFVRMAYNRFGINRSPVVAPCLTIFLFQVKLKCLESGSSPGAVALYLLEPKTCEYILGVESPLICNILSQADDNGLVNIPEMDDLADEVTVSSEDDKDQSHEVTGDFDNTIANGDD